MISPTLREFEERYSVPLNSEGFALQLDKDDELAFAATYFEVPGKAEGEIYFSAHALGPMPTVTPSYIQEELESWRHVGAAAHSHAPEGRKPWTAGHPSGGMDERGLDTMAEIVGAKTSEVAWMGGLSSNIHHLLNSFYRPSGSRFKILYEADAFNSDRFALHSHVIARGLNPDEILLPLRPRHAAALLQTDDILAVLTEHASEIALVFFGAVHWESGQWLDMEAITSAARNAGCLVGWDCAHAAGNVPLKLHDWGVDFAAWCTYKYLCSGPGATAGIFVHERHFNRERLAGWWGNQLDSRFVVSPSFTPREGALGFTISNPSVLATVPVHASMSIYQRIADELSISRREAIAKLRQKSVRLTAYLEHLINLASPPHGFTLRIITPHNPHRRGACLAFTLEGDQPCDQSTYSPALLAFCAAMEEEGVHVEKRPPNLVRLSPSALYNSYWEVWRVGQAVRRSVAKL